MDIRVGRRAQIVIPAAIRRQLGIGEGDLLHADVDAAGRLVLEPVAKDPVARLRAAGRGLYDAVDAVAEQRALRSEWPR